MDIRVVCIGTELLIGHTVNTNLAFIGGVLEAEGYEISREICIPDEPAVMREVFHSQLTASDVLITVGGLGPTRDDITRDAAVEAMGSEMVFDRDVYDHIARFLTCRGVRLRPEALRVQSMVPVGATPLVNLNGTAPGLWCPVDNRVMVLLPGPPRELQPIFTDCVMPRIKQLSRPHVSRRVIKICGVPESIVEERVEKVLDSFRGIEPAYCARPSFVDVRLTCLSGDAGALEPAVSALHREFSREALAESEDDILHSLSTLLRSRNWRLAVAESCTGGAIGAEITSMPGSSDWFVGGFITYSNELKEELLGVRASTLAADGAVSEQTAREMVQGLIDRTGAQCGIAVTGIAGPSGGSDEKPVGLVYIAIAVGKRVVVYRKIYPGNRQTVRDRAKATALVELRTAILSHESCIKPMAAPPES